MVQAKVFPVSFLLNTTEQHIQSVLQLIMINYGALQRLIVIKNILMGNGEIANQLVTKVKVDSKIHFPNQNLSGVGVGELVSRFS